MRVTQAHHEMVHDMAYAMIIANHHCHHHVIIISAERVYSEEILSKKENWTKVKKKLLCFQEVYEYICVHNTEREVLK